MTLSKPNFHLRFQEQAANSQALKIRILGRWQAFFTQKAATGTRNHRWGPDIFPSRPGSDWPQRLCYRCSNFNFSTKPNVQVVYSHRTSTCALRQALEDIIWKALVKLPAPYKKDLGRNMQWPSIRESPCLVYSTLDCQHHVCRFPEAHTLCTAVSTNLVSLLWVS